MKTVVQFIARQSGTVAFLCLAFAFLQGLRVCEGFWQGSGLHGYVLEKGKANMGQMFSVWTSFLNMLIALGVAMLLGLIALRKNGVRLRLENAEGVENPGKENVLRTKRKQRRRKSNAEKPQ